MRIGLGVDQLGVDPDLVARPPDAPFEHIAHTQFTADLPSVDRLVAIRKGGIARDHETVGDAR
jgi:hypothetical protein